ncbi:MAG: hypothetical protein FWD59_10020, partial [Micrococcales bacterium]|nr:hypothetical protein [Micrococcales bacterium]
MSSRISARSAVLLCAAVIGLALLAQGLATAAPTTPTSHNAGYTFTLTATRLDGSALNTAPNYVTTNALVELYDRAGGGAIWLRPGVDYTLTRINDTWTVSDLSANLLTISFSPGGAFIQGYIEVTGPNATIVRPSGPDQPIVDVSTPLSLTVTAPLSPALHGTITDPEGQGGEV